MRIEEMRPVIHDWPEHTKLTEADLDTVTIVPGNPTSARERDEARPARTPDKSSEGPARLIHHPSADDHHDTAVKAMTGQARLALDSLDLPKRGAMAWAYAINYHSDVREELYEAAARLQHALDLIDIHENG